MASNLLKDVLKSIKEAITEVYDLKLDSISDVIALQTLMPLVQEVMKNELMMKSILAGVINDDIRKEIDKFDTFTMLSKIKADATRQSQFKMKSL